MARGSGDPRRQPVVASVDDPDPAPVSERQTPPRPDRPSHAPGGRIGFADPSDRREMARLLPVLVLPLLAYALDQSWLYSGPRWVDPWVYFGIAADFDLTTRYYSDTYYWTRFAWTLPGAAFHRLFDPLAAKYLWHFSFFYVAVLSLYGTLRRLADYPTALVGVIVLALDRMFLAGIGWDYVDGAGATYGLLALYLLTVGATRGEGGIPFVLAGFALGLMVNTYLSLVAFLPCFWLYAVVLLRRRRAGTWVPTLAMALGFGLSILAMMGINRYFTGRWDYLQPSLRVISAVIGTEPYAPPSLYDRFFSYLPSQEGSWLQLPLVIALLTAVATIVASAKRWATSPLHVSAFALYGSTMLVWLGFEVAKRSMMLEPHFFTQLYPAMYLAVAALMETGLKGLGSRAPIAFVGILLVGSIAVLGWHPTFTDLLGVESSRPECSTGAPADASITLPQNPTPFEILNHCYAGEAERLGRSVASFSLLLCGLWIVAELTRDRESEVVKGLSALLLTAVLVATLFLRSQASIATGAKIVWTDGLGDRDVFLAVAEGVARVKRVIPAERAYFYYDAGDRHGYLGNAINGVYFWAYTMVGRRLPEIDCAGPVIATLPRNARIVVMGPNEGVGQVGAAALTGCGLRLSPLEHHRIEQGALSYHLFFYAADRAP